MSIRVLWLVLLGSLLSAAVVPGGGGRGALCQASQPATAASQPNATTAPAEAASQPGGAATQPAAASGPAGEGDGHDLVRELLPGEEMEEHIRFLVACGESFDFALEPQSGSAPAEQSEELSKAAFEENRKHRQPFARRFDRWDQVALFAREANGPITWDEALRYRTALRKAMLAAYDADHDGQLTGEERAAANLALAEGKLPPLKPDKGDGTAKPAQVAPGPAGTPQDANAPREATQAPDASKPPDESEQSEASDIPGAPDAARQPGEADSGEVESDGVAPGNGEG
jgi:hypothetical protein